MHEKILIWPFYTGEKHWSNVCFIYFANTASKFSFPLEHFQAKWD